MPIKYKNIMQNVATVIINDGVDELSIMISLNIISFAFFSRRNDIRIKVILTSVICALCAAINDVRSGVMRGSFMKNNVAHPIKASMIRYSSGVCGIGAGV